VYSLTDVVDVFFSCQPPEGAIDTPPPTPSSEDEMELDLELALGGQGVTPEACEELAMLLWHCVEAYLQVKMGKYTYTLILVPEVIGYLEMLLLIYFVCQTIICTQFFFISHMKIYIYFIFSFSCAY